MHWPQWPDRETQLPTKRRAVDATRPSSPHLPRQLVTVLTSPPPATSAAQMPQPDLRSFFRSLWLRAASLLPSPPDTPADAPARDPRQPHTAALPPAAAAPATARTAENGARKRPGLARDLRNKSKSQPNMRKFAFKARFSSSSAALHKAPAAPPEPVPPDSHFLAVPPPTGHTTGGREAAGERGRPPSPRLVPPPASRFSQRLSGGSLSLFPSLSSSAPTPALSYTTTNTPSTVSLAFSPDTPLDPSTPFPDANDLYAIAELITATASEADLGALAQRRGFRGARLFTAAEPLRTLSTALSPLSPLFAGTPALRRISDAVWGPHAPAAHQGAAPDPFATRGESFYGARAEAGPFADIYDLAAYARPRHRRRKKGAAPRAKAGKTRVNVYVVSMYDARAPLPSRRKSKADAAAAAAAATKHASVASLPARQESKAAPAIARASVAAVPEAEELLDKEYLRSIARAFFTPESSPRTSVASLFTERRQSKGLRPLVLPQQLGLAGAGGDAPCMSEPRNESALRRSLQERRRSGSVATTATTTAKKGRELAALDDLVGVYEWDESMESEVMRLG